MCLDVGDNRLVNSTLANPVLQNIRGDSVTRGTVVERYFQGDQANYVIDTGDDTPDLTVVIQGEKHGVERGEEVGVTVDRSAPLVFD